MLHDIKKLEDVEGKAYRVIELVTDRKVYLFRSEVR